MRQAPLHCTLLVLTLAASACSANRTTFPIDQLVGQDTEQNALRVLHAGDEIEVRFLSAPELDLKLVLPPDGTLRLPLGGPLRAAGQTPEELERQIEAQYTSELRDPNATVLVVGFAGRTVHVGGEVEDPGQQVLTKPTTLLEAIFAAGGPRDTARLEQVLLVRADRSGRRSVYEIDVEEILNGRAQETDLRLLPNDIVFIPRSPIAEVNLWVDQYIRRNLPFDVSVRPDISF